MAEQTQAPVIDGLSHEYEPGSHPYLKAENAVTKMQLEWHRDHRHENFETMTAFINLRLTYPSSMLAMEFKWNGIGSFLIQPYDGNWNHGISFRFT